MSKELSCPAEAVLRLVSGRWKLMVIFWLLQKEQRFNELQRHLGGITHRTLVKQLREMEADGLVERRDYGEIPPRVDYRLTPLGRSLEPVLQAMAEWTLRQRPPPPAGARPVDEQPAGEAGAEPPSSRRRRTL